MPEIPSKLMEQIARLSPEKRALFELRLKERQQHAEDGSAMARSDARNAVPLTFAQQRFWFFDQYEPEIAINNEWTAVRLRGPLRILALKQSILALMQRHDALRTTVVMQDGQPVQRTSTQMSVALQVIDLQSRQDLCAAERFEEAKRQAQKETRRHFDLARGPLFRIQLFKLAAEEHLLLLIFHHIVIDAWSATIFYRELGAFYNSFLHEQPLALPPLPMQYADFAQQQEKWLQSPAYDKALAYWKKQLADLVSAPLQLPTDFPRPPKQSYRGAQQPIKFSAALLLALKELGQQEGASLFMTLLAAFQTLLHRYTGQLEIVVGTPIANRGGSAIEGLIGCFTNTLALRSSFSQGQSFRRLLRQVRNTVLDALSHQEMPFEKLVWELQKERDLSRTPIFEAMLVYNNTALRFNQFERLQVEPVAIENTVAKFDCSLFVTELETEFLAHFEYNADLFAQPTMARMVQHLQTLLSGIVAAPDLLISELPLLSDFERRQMLLEWNATAPSVTAPGPNPQCLHQLFAAQVERTPEAVAIVCETQRMSYRELNARANQLAHHLQKLGVGAEVPVGVYMERSIEMVVGILGILKAGGAYVPLDPAYPPGRLAFMQEDAAPLALLTEAKLLDSLPATSVASRVICLDKDWPDIAQHPVRNPLSAATGNSLAYILYTSGSTGRPKGVEIEHCGPMALIAWALQVFTKDEIAGTLASTSICFDLSVFELFVPLCSGGKVILVSNALHLPLLQSQDEVTLINTVPSAMTELVRNSALPASVKTVNLAGEPLKNALAQQVYQQTLVQKVYNLYGPSEDSTYSTFALVQKGASAEPTIGRPIANTQTYILSGALQPVPIGVIGELYIGGAGLARGYRKRPALTAEKFIPSPFGTNRLYRTGDLARYLPDGNIEFLGRRDNQVKLRGYRIELGEIEVALSLHSQVQDAVVIVRTSDFGDKRLLAYVTVDATLPEAEAATTLSTHLRKTLPDYMIPSAFVVLRALPLLPNGKVDRQALPAPVALQSSDANSFVPPRTPLEASIAEIWQKVLELPQVGIHDDFFALGGHSLLATQVISRCRQIFAVEIALVRLFEERTIARLATAISHLTLSQELQEAQGKANELPSELREEISL